MKLINENQENNILNDHIIINNKDGNNGEEADDSESTDSNGENNEKKYEGKKQIIEDKEILKKDINDLEHKYFRNSKIFKDNNNDNNAQSKIYQDFLDYFSEIPTPA